MARRVVKKGTKSGSAKTRNKNCASLDEDTPSQFAPKTPDQSNKVEKRQRATRESDEMEKEVNTSSVEVEELHHEYDEQKQRPKDLSGAVVPTQLQENHSPGTPQQKPQRKLRRKKHRPKVVIDCQKKKTRKVVTQKSANTKEKPSGKRKYTRKNKLEQTPATPKPTDAKPPTGKRKYERKKNSTKPL
ncbi:uncharacterized protein LOC130782087 [Actinidia eriantha]|uniref:uncharacterized protein LOC130782087 n=1 Tax=Actinidia eriantha TaxID=165200 RepID=UPI00258272AD|nr:uncharacterized protein LOC130782087 [Actinidia eriantha]